MPCGGTLGELSWVFLGEVVGERISSRDIIKWVPCENRLIQLAGGKRSIGKKCEKDVNWTTFLGNF